MSFQPKISIITVVYNGGAEIEGTIKSVLEQTYSNIEYVIIDGASTDATKAIVESYGNVIDRFISEPDNGIYDAMNKGLAKATGDFVWFMNCGDRIFEMDTVSRIVAKMDTDTDIVFGEVMQVDGKRRYLGTRTERTTQKLPAQLDFYSLQKGMVVCHQAFLPRRAIAPIYLEDNLSADIDWVIKCLKKSKKNTPTGMILAQFLIGGISKQQHRKSLFGRYKILQKHYGFFPNIWNHISIFGRAFYFKLKGKR